MSHVVTTTEGVRFAPSLESHSPLTEKQAETRAAQANAQAKELGIETRYEVREADGSGASAA